MRIVSKFKDYYDHVGHRYGEDPDVVYLRGQVRQLGDGLRLGLIGQRREDEATQTNYETVLLVAADFLFPLVRVERETRNAVDESVTETSYQHIDAEMLAWVVGFRSYNQGHYWNKLQSELTALQHRLPDIMRECGAPVFVIESCGGHMSNVVERAPILRDLGVPALVPAEQMWQSIYATLTNVLRHNPDKAPPVEIADRDKIVKAGFDLKTSFRDPVNQKPKKSGR